MAIECKEQQLDLKLKVLSDIDQEILAKCDVSTIEGEIDESETVSTRILECQQCISVALKRYYRCNSYGYGTCSSNHIQKTKASEDDLTVIQGRLDNLDHILGFFQVHCA